MGFSGGGSNILKPHKHNSLTLQDGGNLDFTGSETQSDMTASSMTYSNGTHLQELGIGSAGQHLGISGGVPAWTSTMTSFTTQQSLQTGIFSTSSATFVAVGNGLVINLPTRTNGIALVTVNYSLKNSSAANNYVTLLDDGTSVGVLQTYTTTTEDVLGSISALFPLDGSQIDLGVKCTAGTIFVIQSPGAVVGSICAIEIS